MKKGFVASAVVLILALVCFPLLSPLPQTVEAQSQTLNDTNMEHETDAIIQTFFNSIIKENSSSAYDELFRQSIFTPVEVEQLSTAFRNRLAEVSVRFGKILDYKKHDTKRVDDNVVLSRYILKGENGPTIWSFGFYRNPTTGITNNNHWQLIELYFDAELFQLLQ